MRRRSAAMTLLTGLPPLAAPCIAWADQPPDAAYTFSLEAGEATRVRVTLTCQGDADGTTEVLVDESWGGVRGNGREITDLIAAGADGGALAVRREADHRWRIDHNADEPLTITYSLAQPATALRRMETTIGRW